MSVCIFCKIVEKIIPASIVHESDNCIGFKDLNPVAPNHLLFIPKKHIESVDKMTAEDSQVIGKIIFEMAEYANGISYSLPLISRKKNGMASGLNNSYLPEFTDLKTYQT